MSPRGDGRRARCRCSAVAAVACVVLVLIASPAAAAALTLGIDAGGPLVASDPGVVTPWSARVASLGAALIRVTLPWSSIAPATPPSGFNASDPGDGSYSWASTDAAVRSLTAGGLNVVMLVMGAPTWAEGPNRPSSAPAGTWDPNAAAFGQFAHAAALRYSGHYPDPLHPGRFLPRVRYWEAWNEPNLPEFLNPQWARAGNGYAPESPVIYRSLVNALYAGVKSVSSADRVIAGATAPFGDYYRGGQARMPPVLFVRSMLCLQGPQLRSGHCGAPAHFDILDHHPYDIGSPLQRALNAGDVSIPDIGKLTRLLRAARRAGTVGSRTTKQVWTTEIGWSSRPPDPHGVPLVREAHWLEQALYLLSSEGVSTVFWLTAADPPGPPQANFDAGLYFSDGTPKPAVTAYRFPFVAVRQNAGIVRAWGRAPASGRVVIQRLSSHRWLTVEGIDARAHQVFFVPLRMRGPASLRAREGQLVSLAWPAS